MPTLFEDKISRLTEMTAENISFLLANSARKQFAKGEVIAQEGKACTNCWFIEEGYLRATTTKDGKEIHLNFWLEDTFATNLKSMRTQAPSEFSIVAGEKTNAWEFEGAMLLKLYERSPQFESFGRKLLEELLIEQEEHINLFKLTTPTERYQYIADTKPRLLQRVSLTMLSSYLGISRETLSRIRKR
jgi:CRP-like cAMP-binding protein